MFTGKRPTRAEFRKMAEQALERAEWAAESAAFCARCMAETGEDPTESEQFNEAMRRFHEAADMAKHFAQFA